MQIYIILKEIFSVIFCVSAVYIIWGKNVKCKVWDNHHVIIASEMIDQNKAPEYEDISWFS